MTGPTDPAPRPVSAAPALVAAEPRQRWRLTFERDPVPAEAVGRAVLDAWQDLLASCGLPVAGLEAGGAGKARIAFAAPLPAGARGEAELVDLWLLERLPLWRVREALTDGMPTGHRWVAAEDIWLGAPPLAGRVTAADWRLEVDAPAGAASPLADAARRLLAAAEVPRVRVKGASERRYDLRPLVESIDVDGAGPVVIRMRTRIHPELGAGRPDEVVAALRDLAGIPLALGTTVRERLVLAEEPGPLARPGPDAAPAGQGTPRVRLGGLPRLRQR